MTTRIYQNQSLTSPSTVELDEGASHHLARVLRASIGEPVIVFNGLGGEFAGVITQINKKNVVVELTEHSSREAESSLEIYLAQSISRGEKMDYTIQKAVELGVSRIVPVFTERCNVKLDAERSEKRLQHWQSVVTSACEQSGRNRVPIVEVPQALAQWLPKVEADFRFVLSPNAEHKLKRLVIPVTAKIVLLIGPEGGLSDREVAFAEQYHFLPLNLGPRILRTETAALAAIAALQTYSGDMAF